VGAFPDGEWGTRTAKGRPLSSRIRRRSLETPVVDEVESGESKHGIHAPMRAVSSLEGVCATRGGADGSGANGDHRWMPEMPMNPLVRCVSCNSCWRNIDLDPKNLNETPCQKFQKTRWKVEEMIMNNCCIDLSHKKTRKM
jgi:hypothetical protein